MRIEQSNLIVSLVVITKNPCMEWLESSLRVIDSQTYRSFEIVIVDASDIEVKEKIISLVERTVGIRERARVLDQTSVGLWGAFVEAFSYCRGDVIGVINSDDYLMDENVILDIADVFSDPKVDFMYGNSLRVDSDGRALYCHKPPVLLIEHTVNYFVFVISHHTLYFRKSVLETVPFMTGEVAECVDLDFIRRLLRSKLEGKYLDRTIACFRLHDHNYSKNDSYIATAKLFNDWTGLPVKLYFPFKIITILRSPAYLAYLLKRYFAGF